MARPSPGSPRKITLDQLPQQVAGKSPLIGMMAQQRGPAAAPQRQYHWASEHLLSFQRERRTIPELLCQRENLRLQYIGEVEAQETIYEIRKKVEKVKSLRKTLFSKAP